MLCRDGRGGAAWCGAPAQPSGTRFTKRHRATSIPRSTPAVATANPPGRATTQQRRSTGVATACVRPTHPTLSPSGAATAGLATPGPAAGIFALGSGGTAPLGCSRDSTKSSPAVCSSRIPASSFVLRDPCRCCKFIVCEPGPRCRIAAASQVLGHAPS